MFNVNVKFNVRNYFIFIDIVEVHDYDDSFNVTPDDGIINCIIKKNIIIYIEQYLPSKSPIFIIMCHLKFFLVHKCILWRSTTFVYFH